MRNHKHINNAVRQFGLMLAIFMLAFSTLGATSHPVTEQNPVNQALVDNRTLHMEAVSAKDTGGVIDDFNDGVISDIWNVLATSDKPRVYEANGVLSVDIPEGPRADGGFEGAGIVSRNFILPGDFDIQVDFQLSPDYHSTPEANTKLLLTDQEGDGLEISVRTGHYLSKEVPPFGGPGLEQNFTPTNHLVGKLRIVRSGDLISTYFWDNGWQRHAQWQASLVSGALRIGIDSWNWEPYFLAFSTKFDNVLISNGVVTICHKPGTPTQKTLTIRAQALNLHLGHGDTIGSCA